MKARRARPKFRPNWALLLLGAIVAIPTFCAAEEPPQWTFNPLGWRAEAAGFRAEGLGGFAVRRDVPRCGRVTVEAEVRVERSVGPRWKVAGVGTVYRDLLARPGI